MNGQFDYSFIKRVGDLTGDGVVVYDTSEKKFIYANDNFLNIFEVRHETLSADTKTVLQYVFTEDMEYLIARSKELFTTGALNTTEFRLKLPGDVTKHLSCDVMVTENSNMITAFVKDVSKTKKHEDFLIKYTAQKDIMLDMLTHNLSGPLQLSKDVMASMQKGHNENNISDVSKLIYIMQENTQQCIDIVNDFLREEHFESSLTYVRKTRFDVIDKINIMLVKLTEINKDKKFVLQSELKSLNINSDAVKFFQIIHNLLSNSIKFTQTDGKIEIRVSEEKDFYLIEIADDGVGIPHEVHPLLFNQRIQGRMGLKGEPSKGLGLFIAGQLVKLMSGEIWFKTTVNSGSTFFVKLPKE
ncbi:MAG: hypothetical protein JWO32_108 [Bacteroidetes bacterium]|nr:hypothetical protein [Bacteroidota bacterium]